MAQTWATDAAAESRPHHRGPDREMSSTVAENGNSRRGEPAPRVLVRHALHSYGPRQVLRDVSLRIEAGEIYGLLGPNGAGKTTLMRAISARLRLSKGAVRINGRNPLRSRRARQSLGFVPQEIALYGHLTVRENLEVLGQFAGVKRSILKQTVKSILDQAGLTERADQLCNTLSGGYQRRVNICASLLHQPDVLILDEPTVGIDIKAREAIHQLIEKVRGCGAAVLLTTHDLEQAQAICDRVGIMVDGQIIEEGHPDELIKQAFPAETEVLVTLARVPTDHQSEALARFGLSPTSAPLVWFRRAKAGDANPDDIMKRLNKIGIATKEVRVRQPDLSSLFVALVGRDEPA